MYHGGPNLKRYPIGVGCLPPPHDLHDLLMDFFEKITKNLKNIMIFPYSTTYPYFKKKSKFLVKFHYKFLVILESLKTGMVFRSSELRRIKYDQLRTTNAKVLRINEQMP